jgi:hypothetical protein
MVNKELLDALRYKSEGTDLDFKSEQYRFAGGGDFEKAEMLKDILAIANAWRDGTGYILLGFKDHRPNLAEVVGITENIDDSRLQQFVNSKVTPKLTFRYEEHLYEGKTVGVIAIPKQKRPFSIANPYGRLKGKMVYVRRGSSTEEAEPREIGDMALADAGRGEVRLDLQVLTPGNEPLPGSFALNYLHYTEKFPDFESAAPERSDPFGIHIPHLSVMRDNDDFWREYSEYIRVHDGLVQMQFALRNMSDTQLSNAKLEVTVEPLDGQGFQMLDNDDLPVRPNAQWNPVHGVRSWPEMMARQNPRLVVDDGGRAPVCDVRFGLLLPGEERRSDKLALVPLGPGKLRLRLRILASELSAPQESERVLEMNGTAIRLDFEGFKDFMRERIEREERGV